MPNYKPLATTVSAESILTKMGAKISHDVNTTLWYLVLLYGTAYGMSGHYSGTALVSSRTVKLSNGTVLGWYSTKYSAPSTAAIETFTDDYSRYAVTVKTGYPITLRFYAKG